MLRAFAHHVVCCCVLLRVVATCWKLLDEVWNWSNFRANMCQHFYCFAGIEAWSNNVAFVCTAHPTMLRRRTHTTNKEQSGMYGIVGICVPESFVFSSKDPTCCDLLRAFAHIAQQETAMLAQQCCVLSRAFARALMLFLLFINICVFLC